MTSWGTAFLPYNYDGGDESPSRKTRESRVWRRGDRVRFAYDTASYTGGSGTGSGTWEGHSSTNTKWSYGHPYTLLGRSTGNIGGRFETTKFRVTKFGDPMALSRTGTTWRRFDGVLAPSGGFVTKVAAQNGADSYESARSLATAGCNPLGNDELDAYGTTAIARCAPTNPLVDLSTSAAELLREGLPQVPGTAGNIGGEYLNVQFGYLPLFGDLQDLAKTARHHDELVRQYERDSGRWIRRRYEFPTEVASNTIVVSNATPAPYGSWVGGLYTGGGTRWETTTTTTKIWFEGAFTYHLPRSGWRRSAALLDHLYGVRPGIDTLWELTGYSWLIDYFTNVGDVMKNITAFKQDGLVMPYGYLMCHQVVEYEEFWTGPLYVGGVQRNSSLSASLTYETKQRRLANPFGFGLTDGALSGRQKAILVALGISRM